MEKLNRTREGEERKTERKKRPCDLAKEKANLNTKMKTVHTQHGKLKQNSETPIRDWVLKKNFSNIHPLSQEQVQQELEDREEKVEHREKLLQELVSRASAADKPMVEFGGQISASAKSDCTSSNVSHMAFSSL